MAGEGCTKYRDRPDHQTSSLAFSIRKGSWKYLDHQGSGGNDYDRKVELHPYKLPDKAPDAPDQLYNLDIDPSERTNLYYKHPEIVEELRAQLRAFRDNGRSRP